MAHDVRQRREPDHGSGPSAATWGKRFSTCGLLAALVVMLTLLAIVLTALGPDASQQSPFVGTWEVLPHAQPGTIRLLCLEANGVFTVVEIEAANERLVPHGSGRWSVENGTFLLWWTDDNRNALALLGWPTDRIPVISFGADEFRLGEIASPQVFRRYAAPPPSRPAD